MFKMTVVDDDIYKWSQGVVYYYIATATTNKTNTITNIIIITLINIVR